MSLPVACCRSKKNPFFSEGELASISCVPRHIAVIMDGNRRWDAQYRMAQAGRGDRFLGHWQGARNLFHITQAAATLGVEQLTCFGFSTENWLRSKDEVDALLQLMLQALELYQASMLEEGVKLSVIGDLSLFPDDVQQALHRVMMRTALGTRIEVTLALNYGGRDELVRAIRTLVGDVQKGKLQSDQITEASFSRYLDTALHADPDLVIRTSGEMRVSNFLLWQSAYSEFYTTEVLWPDFSPQELLKAIQHYQTRSRRMGR